MVFLNNMKISKATKEATLLLGQSIQIARKNKKQTEAELSERAKISKTTLRKIESGNLNCEIGIVFELATLVGIKLFDSDEKNQSKNLEYSKTQLMLLPKSIRKKKVKVDDEF